MRRIDVRQARRRRNESGGRRATLTQINAACWREVHDEPARASVTPLEECPANMSARPTAQSDPAVEAAIAKVLAAERAAGDAVAQAKTDAAAIGDQARERARAIAQRAERRMERVRTAFETATRDALADIAAAVEVTDHRELATAADRERIAAAVAALAARLTRRPT
jgi:hypothetical protein